MLPLEKYLESTSSIISGSQPGRNRPVLAFFNFSPDCPLSLWEVSKFDAVLERTFRTLSRLLWIAKFGGASHRVSVVEVTSDLQILLLLKNYIKKWSSPSLGILSSFSSVFCSLVFKGRMFWKNR